jgi:uncharacterized SAM-binding protein YcdF (DUF218 family)
MFFTISKISSFLLSPFFWLCILALAALAIKKHRRKLSITAVIVFLVFSNQALFTVITNWWEDDLIDIPHFNYPTRPIVVLGGYCAMDRATGRTRFNQSGDRLMQALMVRQSKSNQKIVLSGGAANIYRTERGEGAVVKEALVKMGIAPQWVFADSVSRNTYENSLETKKLFDKHQWEYKIILSTSAWHMPRAQSCFEKQGFQVIPLATDHLTPTEPLVWSNYIIPSAGTLASWDLLMREWLGLVVYKIKGYI